MAAPDVTKRGPVLCCAGGAAELTYNLMVVRSIEAARADRVFHALADGTRREIVALVLHSDQSVSEIARRYPISFAAIQKHVAVLERAGLVTKRRHGREQRVSGNADGLRDAHRVLDQLEVVWRARVDQIDALLADPGESAPPGATNP